MKVTPRRKRSDSAAAAVAAAQAVALGPIPPPAHVALRDGDRPFWDAIVTARPRDTWTDIDLTTAANLARCQADIERLQAQLDATGYVIDGKANPLAALVDTLSRRSVALSRALHTHAEATVGRAANSAKAAANERKAREQSDDGLIPKLHVV